MYQRKDAQQAVLVLGPYQMMLASQPVFLGTAL
jgi:hypothetical protein